MRRGKFGFVFCCALPVQLLVAAGAANGAVHEEQLDVPVKLSNSYGKSIGQSIKVTVFWDDANASPAPVLVLNHGRSTEAMERANMGRARYSAASRFFVSRGFIVAVPTRVGYGVSGGEDVEDSGTCGAKRYEPAYAASLAQALTVLEVVRNRPGAAHDRSVLVGQSFGGTTSIAAAAANPSGVVATINFAGGGGGNPKTQPQRPCAPQAMERLFAQYGKTARLPTLWLYTENDQYFGPSYPRDWFKAYKDAGGTGEFTQFAPHGDDGHSLYTKFPETWQPRVSSFLREIGFDGPPRN